MHIVDSGHTPGPWRLDDPTAFDHRESLINDDYHFVDAGDGFHAQNGNGFGLSGFMSIDDARLIAAAPDLLEALIYARRHLIHPDHDTAYVDAVIKKATGER